ncbi:FadR/GntR family transcriptional regulator [Bacilliculturomica massiliensis]|uniref:FadR/GntR family transcriptional regulator n=1 Tax=Bacilliculturomica massiliensis TaxID=1917867 RepID=UPI001031C785|nr:FadR/GntR family transcriptional regulator [Bacilliculturomica massiliensis]
MSETNTAQGCPEQKNRTDRGDSPERADSADRANCSDQKSCAEWKDSVDQKNCAEQKDSSEQKNCTERKDAPGKTYEKVIRHIKEKILTGEYRLGQKLPPERELAQALDVSRNSVREALRTLEIMGVLESLQGAGNYVSGNFEKNLMESMSMMFVLEELDYSQLSQLRAAIEAKALELAIQHRTPAFVEELKAIVTQLAESDDEKISALLDARLHYTIALHSENKLIINILQALSRVMDLFIADMRRKIMAAEMEKGTLQRVHEEIAAAVALGDTQKADAALKLHFEIIDREITRQTEGPQ